MTRRRLPGAALAVALGLVVVGLGACSEPATTLDRAATQRAVDKVIGGRIEPAVEEVTCPARIPRGVGEEVTCTAVLADGLGGVRLQVRQADADGEALDVELLDAVIDTTVAERALARDLVATYQRSFITNCGDPGFLVLAPDETFECRARDSVGPRTVTVTVLDAAGSLSFDLGQAA